MTTGYGTPGMDLGDGCCLSSQAALPPSGLSRQEASQAKPAAANAGAEATAYRGWDVRRGRWPEPDWMATHPNYDASWEGEEDGWVSNGLSATAASYEALCDEIDIIEEERGA